MPLTRNFLSQSLRNGFKTTSNDVTTLISYSRFIMGGLPDKWAELAAGSAGNPRGITLSLAYMSVLGVYVPLSAVADKANTSVAVYYDDINDGDYGYGSAPQNYPDWINSVISAFGVSTDFAAGDVDFPNNGYRVFASLNLKDEFTLVLFEETAGGTWSINGECFFGLRVKDGVIRDNVNAGSLIETLRGLDGTNYNTWVAP